MFSSKWLGEKPLSIAFCISLAATIVPAGMCWIQLRQTQKQIIEIGEVREQARYAHVLTDQIAQSSFNFTSAALDLSPTERVELVEQTDAQLASLHSSMVAGGKLLVRHLTPEDNKNLSHALTSISDTWEDIRERTTENLTATEKAFYFLSLHRDVTQARFILKKLQLNADTAADAAVSSSLRLSKTMNIYLLLTMALGAVLTFIALAVAHRLLRKVTESNRALGTAVAQLNKRDIELNSQNERFSMALNNMSQGLCMFDRDQRLIVCNARFGALYRLPSALMCPGVSIRAILDHCIREGFVSGEAAARLMADRSGPHDGTVTSHGMLELADGRIIQLTHQAMPHGGWVGTHEDVTDRRKADAKIAHMARHDALTGLPNRVLFHEELDRAIAGSQRGDTIAVLYLDLDHFKSVNDTLGHSIGDLLLKEVADRLTGCIRPADTVARLGGDEFAVVQEGIEQLSGTTGLAERIIEVLSAPYDIDGHHVIIGTSVGVALAPLDGNDANELLKCADLALYRAKGEGRGTYRFFEAEMDARMQARRALELDLRKALIEEQFEVYYQPLIVVETEEVSGFEALLRWKHAERGFVSPAEFIPLAEEIGLIGRIGAWVLKQACSEAAKWPSHAKVAVNLSPVQFKGQTLVLDVMAALGTSGLPAHRLELEITESVMLQDTEWTLGILHQLRNLGVKISMDDFGTGYSSLSYLRKFPFDKIKIDQSFVRDLSAKSDCVAIIRAVAALSADLGMSTTAEGVETQEQFERLKLEGCTEVQGYLFSKARPAADVAVMMSERRVPSLSPALALEAV